MSARRRCLLLAPFAWLGACAAPVAPPLPPGSLVALPQPAANPLPGAAHGVRATLLAVRTAPPGASLPASAAAILSDRGAPFRALSVLPAASCWLQGPDAAAWLQEEASEARTLASATGVVDADLTTAFDAGTELPRVLCEPGPTATIRVALRSRVAPHDRSELLLLRTPLAEGDTAVLFVPLGNGAFAGRAIVLQHTGAASPAEVARAHADLPVPAATAATRDNWQLAIAAIGEHNRRPALLAIARAHGAPRTVDVLLAADEPALVAIGTEVAAAGSPGADPFAFERAVWRGLLPRLERDELPASLLACLRRALGALADDPTTLRAHLAGDGERFATALREENLLALEDPDALVRTTAHEWLRARALAVPGYEPCADDAARRAALQAHAAAATEAAR